MLPSADVLTSSPISGLRVLVTRAEEQAEDLARMLREAGAVPEFMPTIAVTSPARWDEMDAAIERLDEYDGVLFTSANGVRAFCDRLCDLGRSTDALRSVRCLAAVGPQTGRALAGRVGRVDVVAVEHTAEGLFETLATLGVAGRRFLMPCADVAREALPALLTAAGATVDVVVAYRTIGAVAAPDILARLKAAEIDVVTLLSPSAVDGLRRVMPDGAGSAAIAVIGPTTRAACERLGIRVDIEAQPHTMAALVDAIERHFARRT